MRRESDTKNERGSGIKIAAAGLALGAIAILGYEYGPSVTIGNTQVGIVRHKDARTAPTTTPQEQPAAPTTCGTKTAPGAKPNAPTIVLDPGHSGTDVSLKDQTGLMDHDYPTVPEIEEVFTISEDMCVKLATQGYKVVMTKQRAQDTVSLRQRAIIAEESHATLAVSVHNDHSASFGKFKGVYAQTVGGHRDVIDEHGKVTSSVAFTNQATANKSQEYAKSFIASREKAEGGKITATQLDFANRSGINPGNIAQVQLYAPNTPWVYNEVGGKDITAQQLQAYQTGLLEAITTAVPIS